MGENGLATDRICRVVRSKMRKPLMGLKLTYNGTRRHLLAWGTNGRYRTRTCDLAGVIFFRQPPNRAGRVLNAVFPVKHFLYFAQFRPSSPYCTAIRCAWCRTRSQVRSSDSEKQALITRKADETSSPPVAHPVDFLDDDSRRVAHAPILSVLGLPCEVDGRRFSRPQSQNRQGLHPHGRHIRNARGYEYGSPPLPKVAEFAILES